MADPCKDFKVRPEIAKRIEPAFAWDNLLLSEMLRKELLEIASHIRRRLTPDDRRSSRKKAAARGISALFRGPSGTGKRIAAEVLAGDLQLDLYRIDLTAVVSKFIGETEKNLRRIFEAAEESGPILFFDEADALFGERSEVTDSHDRFINIELNYLLGQMEQYRGLAILATNHKSALDLTFLRRFHFVVKFPLPHSHPR